MERINVINRAILAAPFNETIEFQSLVVIEEVLLSVQTASVVTLNFGQAGSTRGLPAAWTQSQLQVRFTGATSAIRATPRIETRRLTVDIGAGATSAYVTVFFRYVEK